MKLLDRYEALSPIYNGGLTNHLSMIIIALHKLGVDESLIEEIAEQYQHVKNIPDLTNPTHAKLPEEDQYISLTNFYIGRINKLGLEETISWYLGKVKNGLASGLFHGVIRLFYSLLQDDPLYIAQAMAYFEVIFFECIIPAKSITKLNDEFHDLKEYRKINIPSFKTIGSMSRFEELIEHEELLNGLFTFSENKEEQMLSFLTLRYLETLDFYILHTITGFHALVSLKRYFDDYNAVLDNFFVHALLFTLFNVEDSNEVGFDQMSVEKAVAKAGTLLDAHKIKLLHTIKDLYEMYNLEDLLRVLGSIFQK